MRAGIAVAAVCVALATSTLVFGACASSAIRAEEIPAEPIAFVYYDAETSRKRSERAQAEIEAKTGGDPQKPGVARMDDITDLISDTLGAAGPGEPDLQGRLALLDARSGDFELVEGALRGAVPQDWSSDHARLLFSQVVHHEVPQLFELVVESGIIRRLTYGRTAHPEGCYGPEGTVVVTSVDPRQRPPEAKIFLTDREGRPKTQLSSPGYAYYPPCAPDGDSVAWTTIAPGGRGHRVVIRSPLMTGQPRALSRGAEPSFSADGEWLAFSAKLKRDSTIWMMRPDGTARRSLGSGGYAEHRPSLSPDNRLVVYVADTRYHQELYLRRVDGTGNRILFTDGDGDRPIW